MANSIQEERLRWVLPVVSGRTRLVETARVFPHGQRTLERWVGAYKARGAAGLIPRSTRPKTHARETPIRIKERVVELRRKSGRCALKISWQLALEGIRIHRNTVHKIIRREGLVRRYRKRKVKYEYVRTPLSPGELVEIDVKYVPGKVAGKRYFQYTAIDCASRWRHLRIYEDQSNWNSVLFLEETLRIFPYPVLSVKTDNGFIFTNRYTGTYKREDLSPMQLHAFDRCCAERGIVHYLIDPGKPAQNGKVERSHRSDQESFYDRNRFSSPADLKRKLRIWNTEYNNLAHCGLNGRSPNEFLKSYSSR